jgi:hypothetical protein
MEAVFSSETSVDSTRLYGIISQKIELFITTALRISHLTKHDLFGARKSICKTRLKHANLRFTVVATVKITTFWDVMLCLVEVYQCPSKMSVNIYQSTRCHLLEGASVPTYTACSLFSEL